MMPADVLCNLRERYHEKITRIEADREWRIFVLIVLANNKEYLTAKSMIIQRYAKEMRNLRRQIKSQTERMTKIKNTLHDKMWKPFHDTLKTVSCISEFHINIAPSIERVQNIERTAEWIKSTIGDSLDMLKLEAQTIKSLQSEYYTLMRSREHLELRLKELGKENDNKRINDEIIELRVKFVEKMITTSSDVVMNDLRELYNMVNEYNTKTGHRCEKCNRILIVTNHQLWIDHHNYLTSKGVQWSCDSETYTPLPPPSFFEFFYRFICGGRFNPPLFS
jgi:hypothetical protein